jgi:quercetin dioxygenase-like cupin family protein
VLAFTQPADFKWKDSAEFPGLSSVVLSGDPSKPGLYAVRNRFAPGSFSRPHFHPNDRFIIVVSGTWWVGTGPVFDAKSTTPMPVGSFVTHYADKIHYDGAKDEACEVVIYGMGPATTTRVGDK